MACVFGLPVGATFRILSFQPGTTNFVRVPDTAGSEVCGARMRLPSANHLVQEAIRKQQVWPPHHPWHAAPIALYKLCW